MRRGVPQGYVLGPLLYVLYTSPIADIINLHNLHYHLYADDTQLYVTFKTDSNEDLQSVKSKVEDCARNIDCWMVDNGLKLNQDKTELIVISSKYRPEPVLDSVQVGDERITPKSSARNLGVIFDNRMSLNEHIAKICKSSQYHLSNIGKIRKLLDQNTTEILLHAFVSSKMDNCNELLFGLPKYQLNRLQLIQNTAARIATLTKKYDHVTPVLIKLHWLPVHFRIIFKVNLLVYKGLNGLAPGYISDLLSYKTCSRSLRSSSQKLLDVPKSRTKTYGDRAFEVAAPRLWNSLPFHLRTISNINIFKNQMKTYLFKLAYNDYL